jgi:hypothetical protein
MEIRPEPRQHGMWSGAGIFCQAVHHGFAGDFLSFGENNENAKAVLTGSHTPARMGRNS